MATPTRSAQIVIDSQGEDFVQLVKSSGGIVSWIDNTGAPQGALAAAMGGTPGGTNTAVQFNDSGTFGGTATDGTVPGISWDKTTGSLTVAGGTGGNTLISGGPSQLAAFGIDNTGTPVHLAMVNEESGGDILIEADQAIDIGSDNSTTSFSDSNDDPIVQITAAGGLGFYGATPIAQPQVTGSKGGNAALTSLIAQLVALGLITDGTS